MKPVIRAATFSDIPAIVELLAAAFQRSRLAHLPFSEARAKKLTLHAIQRHGRQTDGGAFVAVAVRETGELEGVIMGAIQPLYHVLDAFEATDLFWVTAPGAHPWTAYRLLKPFRKWAMGTPHIAVIRMAVTDTTPEGTRPAALLVRAGLRHIGALYELGTT